MKCTCLNTMTNGRCPHCDTRPAAKGGCPSSCAGCYELNCVCQVCKSRHGTPAKARSCETACRRAEVKAARKRA